MIHKGFKDLFEDADEVERRYYEWWEKNGDAYRDALKGAQTPKPGEACNVFIRRSMQETAMANLCFRPPVCPPWITEGEPNEEE